MYAAKWLSGLGKRRSAMGGLQRAKWSNAKWPNEEAGSAACGAASQSRNALRRSAVRGVRYAVRRTVRAFRAAVQVLRTAGHTEWPPARCARTITPSTRPGAHLSRATEQSACPPGQPARPVGQPTRATGRQSRPAGQASRATTQPTRPLPPRTHSRPNTAHANPSPIQSTPPPTPARD